VSRKAIYLWVFTVFLVVGFSACGGGGEHDLDAALASITADDLAAHVRVLASDEFEGRFPGTRGEELTTAYLKEQFERIGLEPGNGGSYFQDVPLMKITNDPGAVLRVEGGERPLRFAHGDQFVAWTVRARDRVEVRDSEIVFVGYGIVAPEYDWNDYRAVDVRGKTVMMLVNDPGFATGDETLFKGSAMTYYGRWTYKFEEAARQGAAGAMLVHETAPAAYDWGVVVNSWNGTRYSLKTPDGNASRCAVEAWVTRDVAGSIVKAAGLDIDVLKPAALQPGFEAVPLDLRASVAIDNRIEEMTSRNVLARLPGTTRADEVIVFTAHWDHVGRDSNREGDQIFNGAVDNAASVAAVLEWAEAFTHLGGATGRSLLFMAVTCEEQYLLGSEYYVAHPVFPMTKTVADLNMDAPGVFGRTEDVRVYGYGQSELEDYAREAAAFQDRVIVPNFNPETGYFYRSDHFSFARAGVPALYINAGYRHREKGEEYGRAAWRAYYDERYHKPTDEIDDTWDLSGLVEDVRLMFRVGYRLSMESTFPNWKPGSEFKTRRDADMAGR